MLCCNIHTMLYTIPYYTSIQSFIHSINQRFDHFNLAMRQSNLYISADVDWFRFPDVVVDVMAVPQMELELHVPHQLRTYATSFDVNNQTDSAMLRFQPETENGFSIIIIIIIMTILSDT